MKLEKFGLFERMPYNEEKMKKVTTLILTLSIAIVSLFAFAGCNEVPKELQGTYRNGTAGSQWIVTKTTAKASPQALLYNFTYKGVRYDNVIVYESNEGTLSIDPSVKVTGDLVANMSGISKANKITSTIIGDTIQYDYTNFDYNQSITVVGYQFEYQKIVYLVVSGCQHILVQ